MLYSFDLSIGRIAQFTFLRIILSIGSAGVKGSGIISSTVLLEMLGIPLGFIPIPAAIRPVNDPAHTLLDNVSDLVGTALVARPLGEMDEDVFYDRNPPLNTLKTKTDVYKRQMKDFIKEGIPFYLLLLLWLMLITYFPIFSVGIVNLLY